MQSAPDPLCGARSLPACPASLAVRGMACPARHGTAPLVPEPVARGCPGLRAQRWQFPPAALACRRSLDCARSAGSAAFGGLKPSRSPLTAPRSALGAAAGRRSWPTQSQASGSANLMLGPDSPAMRGCVPYPVGRRAGPGPARKGHGAASRSKLAAHSVPKRALGARLRRAKPSARPVRAS